MKLLLTHGTPSIKIQGLNCSITADSQCGIDAAVLIEKLIKSDHEVTVLTNDVAHFDGKSNTKTIEYKTLDELIHKFRYLIGAVEYDGIAHLAWLPPVFSLDHRWIQGSETLVHADESSWHRDRIIVDLKVRDGVRDPIVKLLCKDKVAKTSNVLCRLGIQSEYTRNFRSIDMSTPLASVKKYVGEKISMFVCDVYATDGICEDMILVSQYGASVFKHEQLQIAVLEALTFKDNK